MIFVFVHDSAGIFFFRIDPDSTAACFQRPPKEEDEVEEDEQSRKLAEASLKKWNAGEKNVYLSSFIFGVG